MPRKINNKRIKFPDGSQYIGDVTNGLRDG